MNTEIDRKIAVILIADVVGYSKHMERDENATLKAYAECEKILKGCLRNIKDLSLIQPVTPLWRVPKCSKCR